MKCQNKGLTEKSKLGLIGYDAVGTGGRLREQPLYHTRETAGKMTSPKLIL